MLPGFGDSPEDFEDHGFVGLVPRAGIDADVLTVGARMKYYVNRDLLPSLKTAVIEPAREKGYESIWFLGISMGGLGAVLAAREFPDDVDGLILLSPFLGKPKTIEAIKAAGGPAAWNPPPAGDDYTIELWRWLKGYQTSPQDRPPIYLGYGTKEADRPYPVLGSMLPENNGVVAEGRHGWKTWEKLFPELLSRGALQ
jgi:pimeloyl-ACP methyl ester carboxylesterase